MNPTQGGFIAAAHAACIAARKAASAAARFALHVDQALSWALQAAVKSAPQGAFPKGLVQPFGAAIGPLGIRFVQAW